MDTLYVRDPGSLGRSAPSGPALIIERPLWMADAACCWADPELWFPGKGDWQGVERAKAICARCPVQPQCLDYALSFDAAELDGIWAGMTKGERQRLRRERRRRYRTRAA